MPHLKPRFNYFKAPDKQGHGGFHIIFYCEWGDIKNKDIVVCVHGLSRNSRDFDYLARGLAEKYRVICIDIAGRGKSEWLSNKLGYDYETYVADVLDLLHSLGIKHVNWVGTSMGGIIGMIIASKHHKLIKKLVLNDIGPVISGQAIERILRYVGSSHAFKTKADAEKSLRERMSTFGVVKEEHWRHIAKHSIIRKLDGKYMFAYDPAIVPIPKLLQKLKFLLVKIVPSKKHAIFKRVDLHDIWEKITCPILVLRGKESDILTKEVAEEMIESKKKSIKMVEFEGVGHAPMLMDEVQISVVKKWLAKG